MKFPIGILTIIFSLLSFSANAGDFLLGQYTYHFDEKTRDNDKYMEAHPLIGYTSKNYTIIAMQNTYRNFSVSALYTKKIDISKNITLAASAGAASGYKEKESKCKHSDVICVAYISADIHPSKSKFGLVITYAPNVFVGAGLRFSF